jgi:hypothetical protein
MKRKIGIIIAAIVAISGIALSGVLSGRAYAATYCTYDGKDMGNKAKRCAHILMVNNYTKMSGSCVPESTKGTSSTCKDKIKSYTQFTLNMGNDTVNNNARQAFVDAVANKIKLGPAGYDPCKYAAAAAGDCMKSEWPYYYDTNPNGGSNGGGGNGNNNGNDDDDDEGGAKKGKEKAANTGDCTSILPSSWCNKDNPENVKENGVTKGLKLVISIMTGAVVVAGTIGIIICGVLWMTARDNEAQVATAKRRLLEIVIGIVAWGLISVLINFLIPQEESTTNSIVGVETTIVEEKDA